MFDHITSLQNIHEAWQEFVCGKRLKPDVAEFQLNFSFNMSQLHSDLRSKIYKHGPYKAFPINDPKPRIIHKAMVRDRLLHHAIHRVLYPYFDNKFVFDSYSCRDFKGTHRAMRRLDDFVRKVSQNNRRTCWILKCDIRKFFASVDQEILIKILAKHIADKNTLWLLGVVIKSFYSAAPGKGLPLGNLTSQILANVYMNEFDQFVKHGLKHRHYIRYADDFVLMHTDRTALTDILPRIGHSLEEKLKLSLHPDKVFIKALASGVDFLGWVHFPHHRVLRTATKKRMFRNIKAKNGRPETVQSYLGLLSHGNAWKLQKKIAS
jgi:RNA-directed DNA polymerase